MSWSTQALLQDLTESNCLALITDVIYLVLFVDESCLNNVGSPLLLLNLEIFFQHRIFLIRRGERHVLGMNLGGFTCFLHERIFTNIANL